jgi:titin
MKSLCTFEALESRELMSITPGGIVRPVPPGAPAAPSALTASATGSAVKLHWTNNAKNQTGFAIKMYNPVTGYATIGYAAAEATYFTEEIAPSGLDSFEVVALVGTVSSAPSNVVSVPVNNDTVVTVVAPQIVNATALTKSEILLSWSADGGATKGYTVERSINGTNGWTTIGSSIAGHRSFLDSKGLNAGTKYFYRIVALGNNSVTATSGVFSATTLSA